MADSRHTPWWLTMRCFVAAKTGEPLLTLQDCCAYSERNARAAVTDGAGSAYRARDFARALARHWRDTPPADGDSATRDWIAAIAEVWRAAAPTEGVPWWASPEQTLDRHGAATMVTIQLYHDHSWTSTAIGDSCLFHLRDGAVIATFPLNRSEDFTLAPDLVSSNPRRLKEAAKALRRVSGDWMSGDVFLLATDALSEYLLRRCEQDGPSSRAIRRVLDVRPNGFTTLIDELRREEGLAEDDVCLLRTTVVHDPA